MYLKQPTMSRNVSRRFRPKPRKLIYPIFLILTLILADFATGQPSYAASSHSVMRVPTDFKPCETTDNDVGGSVFLDYDSDGEFDPNEDRYSGADILVSAYDIDGAIVMSTTTNTSGYWSLESLADQLTGSNEFRIVFGPLPSHLRYSVHGADSQTNTRFVNATTCQVTLGVLTIDGTCQNDPLLFSTCFVEGDNVNGENSGDIVGQASKYFDRGNSVTGEYKVSAEDIGSTYGVAWHVPSQQLFVSSYVKQAAGLGPNGSGGTTTGGIYTISDDGLGNGNGALFTDLQSAVGTGADPHPTANDTCASALLSETSNRGCWHHDADTFDKVGKLGLGDIDFSPDFDMLYAVNLNNRSLVAIETGLQATSVISSPVEYDYSSYYSDCTDSSWRPFALGRHNGNMYLGVTCTAENSLNSAQLDAIVYEFSPAAPASLTRVLRVDLDYTRDGQIQDCSTADSGFPTTCSADWQPWSDNINLNNAAASQVKYITRSNNGFLDIVYPQPMLSDIEFTGDDMLLGFRDRSADQYGTLQGSPFNSFDSRPWSANSAGELLCASYNETTGNFRYDIEFNGICGSKTAAHTHSNEGIGGNEFFDDNNILTNNGAIEEVSFGGLAIIPGKDQVAMTQMNPTSSLLSGGFGFYNVSNGSAGIGARNYELAGTATAYDRLAGIGDVEPMCAPAPLEIGNRIWHDVDGNGIQDPGESGLDGVTVMLTCGADSTTTITQDGGQYYFNSSNNAPFMDPGEACTLMFPAVYDLNGNSIVPTRRDAGELDSADSDINTGGKIELTLPAVASSNHDYDAGYSIVRFDWGDLPDSFGTTAASDGARHRIDDDLYLGSCVDDEGTGAVDTFAGVDGNGGDDNASGVAFSECADGDDEDGIELVTSMIPGFQACVNVTARNTTASPAVLQAWFDYDGDLSFAGDPFEEITFTNGYTVPVGTIDQQYCFDVPTADELGEELYLGGDIHMRFRLSRDGGLSYDGEGTHGEVEDYHTPLACIGNYVWIDWDEDGFQDEDLNAGTPEVEMVLYWYGMDGVYDDNSNDDMTYSVYTDETGSYSFCGLLPNDEANTYEVQIPDSPIPVATKHIAAHPDDEDSNAMNGGQVVRVIRTFPFDLPAADYTAANWLNLPIDEAGRFDGNGTISSFPDSSVDLTIDIGLDPHDSGDLPDNNDGADFPTTYRSYGEGPGALHILAVPLYLGDCVDSESNGSPDIDAGNGATGGDDNRPGYANQGSGCDDDEDGIELVTPLIPGNQACIEVTVTKPADMPTAVLQAWIDFDGSSSFGTYGDGSNPVTDANELLNTGDFAGGQHIFTENAEDVRLCFDVPQDAKTLEAASYARFRLSDDALDPFDEVTLNYYGAADKGEVEDYRFNSLFCVGNYVWIDSGSILNVQDPGDTPVANHPMRLVWGGPDNLLSTTADNIINTTMTDSTGRFEFCGLRPDSNEDSVLDEYEIVMDNLPAGSSAPVLVQQGTDIALDSNGWLSSSDLYVAVSLPFTLPTGNEAADNAPNDPDETAGEPDEQNDLTFDFGFVPGDRLYALGNYIWADRDGNGIFDSGETPIDGVDLILIDILDNVVMTTTTNSDGAYLFDSLPAGNYRVLVPASNFAPGGALYSTAGGEAYGLTPNPDGDADDTNVCLDDPSRGVSSPRITLGDTAIEPGTETHGLTPVVPLTRADLTVDCGFMPPPLYAIGNLVWEDEDRDSEWDNGANGSLLEAGIEGIEMELLNQNGTVLMTTTTEADGGYLFDLLEPGTYQVRIPNRNFLEGGALYDGPTDAPFFVSPRHQARGTTDDVMIGFGSSESGVVSPIIILGDGAEPGFVIHGPTPQVDIDSADLTLDFGFFHDPLYAVGNIVWEDLNENRVYDEATEDGLSGVLIELLNSAGNVVMTTTTNANGAYLFDNLQAGSYQINIPASNFEQDNALFDTANNTAYQPTAKKLASTIDDGMVGIGTPFAGVQSSIFTLGDGIEPGTNDHGIAPASGVNNADLTQDFGFIPGVLYAVGNVVWEDTNDNGVYDEASEDGIGGVLVQLLDDSNTVLQTDTTNSSGGYLFDNLPAGKYQIKIPSSNFTVGNALYDNGSGSAYRLSPQKPADLVDDGMVGFGDPNNGVISLILTLGDGVEPGTDTHGDSPAVGLNNADLTLDFGFVPGKLYAIGNLIFKEATDAVNGVYEPELLEEGIPNVLLELRQGNAVITTTRTDANGAYLFDRLPAGTYTVKLPFANFLPAGALFDQANQTPLQVSPQKPSDVVDDGMVGFGTPFQGIIAVVTVGDDAVEPGTTLHGIMPTVGTDNADLTVDMGFFAPDATAVGVQAVSTTRAAQPLLLVMVTGLLFVATRRRFRKDGNV